MNKVLNPETWRRSYNDARGLARLCAAVAHYQLRQGRHFLIENPRGSLLWEFLEWKELLQQHEVYVGEVDQCEYGLVTKEGEPIRKPTRFVASSPILLKRLRKRCGGGHVHMTLEGSARTRRAA